MKITKDLGYVTYDELEHYRLITRIVANKLSVRRLRGGRDAFRRKTEAARDGSITAQDWLDWFPKALLYVNTSYEA